MRVDKSQIGQLDPIAKGAEGQVYRLTPAVPAGFHLPLAYKEVLPVKTRALALEAMEHATGLRDAMDQADRDLLDGYTTWPLAMVDDKGAPVGALMPLIGSDFFIETRPPGRAPESKVFAFSYLCAKDALLMSQGITLGAADDPLIRLALITNLCFVIALLHKHQIVYGDLSLKNIAIANDPPRIMLVDCDPAASLSNLTRNQLHSPGFFPPEQQKLQDLQTDVYKLGLCALRGMFRGTGVTQLKDPQAAVGTLNAAGVALLTRALSANRADRPTAKELFEYFYDSLTERAAPPTLTAAALNRMAFVRGRDVVVNWSGTGARHLRIYGNNGFSVQVPEPDRHPNGFAITPPTAGDIMVEATNRHGTVTLHAGYVDPYELPELHVEDQHLPVLEVPDVQPVQIPDVLAALPPRPTVTTETHPVPTLDAPDLVSTLAAIRPIAAPPELQQLLSIAATTVQTLERVHRDANRRLAEMLTDTERRPV